MSPLFKSRLLATQSDDRLVALVRSGHEAAFEALVHRYRRPLLRYCRRLCLGDARAEEALQQALMNAWIAMRNGSEVRDARAWLYRVAHNAAINAMRKERAISSETLTGDPICDHPTAARSSLDEMLMARDALASIAALPRMQREVMVRAAVAGDSHEEVASALGISDGAVRGLLYRARASLRAGFTAITPAPLLAWAADAGGAGGVGGQRIAELASGGGTAGLAGLMAKGGAVAVTAGLAIGGSMLAHHDVSSRHGPAHVRHQLASQDSPRAAGPLAASGGRSVGTLAGHIGAAGGRLSLMGARAGSGRRGVSQPARSHFSDGAKRGDRRSGGDASRSPSSHDGGSQSSSNDTSTSESRSGDGQSSSGGGSPGGDGVQTSTTQTSTTVTETSTSSSDGGAQEPSLSPSTELYSEQHSGD